jgi:hypothetical protein
MSRSKLLTVLTVVLFIFGIAAIDCAVAGEKIKWHGTGITTKFEKIEVGDEEGHIIAIAEAKQVFINETTGEKTVSTSKNIMDINPKAGQVTVQGYGVSTWPNGDKLIRAHKGKMVGKGHMKGTYSYIKGAGNYEGVKGGGTWDSYSLAPQVSYYEVEGEMELPGQ